MKVCRMDEMLVPIKKIFPKNCHIIYEVKDLIFKNLKTLQSLRQIFKSCLPLEDLYFSCRLQRGKLCIRRRKSEDSYGKIVN